MCTSSRCLYAVQRDVFPAYDLYQAGRQTASEAWELLRERKKTASLPKQRVYILNCLVKLVPHRTHQVLKLLFARAVISNPVDVTHDAAGKNKYYCFLCQSESKTCWRKGVNCFQAVILKRPRDKLWRLHLLRFKSKPAQGRKIYPCAFVECEELSQCNRVKIGSERTVGQLQYVLYFAYHLS